MEKPNWAKRLEEKILEISKNATTSQQFWIGLIGYCNGDKIAISLPKQLEQEGFAIFLAQKTDEVGTPSSLQVLKIRKEEFANIASIKEDWA
jgi:hypothetical protein